MNGAPSEENEAMTLDELKAAMEIPGVMRLEPGDGGLACLRITTAACEAEVYLHGAHVTKWQPKDEQPVLWLSPKSAFAAGKAIRGGVPVIFPWFGARTGERTDGPMHGFARTAEWTPTFAAMCGDDLTVTLTLGADDVSRALGWDGFQAAMELTFGKTLTMKLSVANNSEEAVTYEEALHTYFVVGDVRQAEVTGLQGTEYLDKTDEFKRKTQEEEPLGRSAQTDRPYLNTEATVSVSDPVLGRVITVDKLMSKTTVVWNPWAEACAKMADMPTDGWETMLCVETANAAENAVTLPAKTAHTMMAKISVGRL